MAQLGSTVVNGNLSVTGGASVNGSSVIVDSKAQASGGTALSLVTTGEKYTWNSKYAKPSGGIPRGDMTSDVQTALDKCDKFSIVDSKLNVVFSVNDYSTSSRYYIGDYCIYSSTAKVCIKDTPNPAGSFNSTYWENC